LITAQLANDYGRDVYALPGSLDNPCSAGCLELINQGAQMILNDLTLITALGQMPSLGPEKLGPEKLGPEKLGPEKLGPDETSRDLARSPLQASREPSPGSDTGPAPNLSPAMAQVLATVMEAPMTLDQLVQQLDQSTGEILATLVQLELMGLVTQLPGMRYQRP
jgi:DNA processing protein